VVLEVPRKDLYMENEIDDVPLFYIDGTNIIILLLIGLITFAMIFGWILTGW
jgi:hypothetical protein